MKKFARWIIASLLAFTMLGAAAADVLLGPGDVLKISVYGNPDLGLETRVSETGAITFPLLGQVEVGGQTVAGAEKKLAGLLESGGYVRKAQVNIIVTVIQSQQVSVLGQVNRPGRYPVEGKRSLMDMLAMAGGVAADGGDTVSLIRKRNGVVTKDVIDVIQMVRSGELGQDFELAGNDVIYVERAPRFYIYGEVQRPGMFRLERTMTVVQALSAGGGLTPRGTERGMLIKRRDAQGKVQLIDAKQDDLLQTDDVVYVKESWF
ncbi:MULTISPECIES: polysaccharide export protein EpsE [unclassified Duganella]|uniref:polysaccharide export protein EpsE n=1 Tax=unclassified Duganella TaxID=2636909 RepID=UPI000E34A71C|nr:MULTISPECIES: polysaccharide export protein EpsE [unclassified Duganella]RFP09611.1 polysaccharide export protein EpsE [Duganella sp. BJB475]RFP27731.1 polysaccharide export protein EpsE [Duganella sp. BJB476]